MTKRVGELVISGRIPREIARILRMSEKDVKKLIARWEEQQREASKPA